MRRAGTHLLVAYLVSALVRGSAAAAPAPKLVPLVERASGPRLMVVIAPLDSTAKEQTALLEQLAETAVDQSGRYELVPAHDAFDPGAALQRAQHQADAVKLSAEAQKAIDELDSAKATQLYGDAVAAWRGSDLSRHFDGLVEAWAGKAGSHAVSGETAHAKAEISAVLNVSQTVKFSDAQLTPELLKLVEKDRKAISAAKGKLTVRTEPAGARVWVDGVFRGLGPVTAEGLGPGKHVVVAALGGYALTVADSGPGALNLTLPPAEQAFALSSAISRIAKDPEGPGRDKEAKQLGEAARADQVLLLTVKKALAPGQLVATGVRLETRDGHNLAYRTGPLTVDAGQTRAAEDFISSLLEHDDPRQGGKPVTHFAGGGSASGKRVAGIALIAGALGCAASWGIFGFSAMNEARAYRALPQVESLRSAQAVASGRTFALAADVSWGVGLAMLAVGIVLAFVPFGASGKGAPSSTAAKQTTEDDPMRAYRQHVEEQRRLDEQRARDAEAAKKNEAGTAAPPAAEEKTPEAPADNPPAVVEEKKPEPEKPLTPAEKRRRDREEKKRKAAEERAEKKRKAEEARQRRADEKRKAEEDRKAAAEEKKRRAEEEKKAAAEASAGADEKKRHAEEAQKAADEKKAEDEKRLAEEKAAEEKRAAAQKQAEDEKAAEEKKAEDEKNAAEEKKAEDEKKAADQKTADGGKPLTPAEKKRREREEKKRKAEEEKAAKKAADEEKKRKAEEEQAAKKGAAEEQKRKVEEEKQRQAEEKKAADEGKKPDGVKAPDEQKQAPKSEDDDLRNF